MKVISKVLLILMLTYLGCAKKTPQDKLREAEQALQKRDILAAVIILEEIIEKHAQEPVADDARILLARANYLSGDFESCRQLLGMILKKYGAADPRGIIAFNITLGTFAQERKYDEGIKFIQQTIHDSKTTGTLYWELNFALADFYRLKNDTPSSKAIFKKIMDQAGEERIIIFALENMVALYERDKDPASASKLYEDYLATHKETKFKNMLLGGMAYYYEKQGKVEEAGKIYAEAIAGFEADAASAVTSEEKVVQLVQLAKLYTLKTDYQKALEIYEKILKDFPNERDVPVVMLEMAGVLSQLKQYDKALNLLNRIVQRWPRTAIAETAWQMMGRIREERAQMARKEGPTTSPLAIEIEEKPTSPAESIRR